MNTLRKKFKSYEEGLKTWLDAFLLSHKEEMNQMTLIISKIKQ